MKERGGRVHWARLKGDGKGADAGAISDADVDTKKEQHFERQ